MKKRCIGYSNDLTDSFLKARQNLNTPTDQDSVVKNRFLVRKGLLQSIK